MGVENEVGEGERREGGRGGHRGIQLEIAEVEDEGEELDLRGVLGFLELTERGCDDFEVLDHVGDERIHAVAVSIDRKKQRVAVVGEDFFGVRCCALFRLPTLRGSRFRVDLGSIFHLFILNRGFVYRHRLSGYRLIHLAVNQWGVPNQCGHLLRLDYTRVRGIYDLHVNISLNT